MTSLAAQLGNLVGLVDKYVLHFFPPGRPTTSKPAASLEGTFGFGGRVRISEKPQGKPRAEKALLLPSCGLVLCTAIRPEPIAPGATCPSCSKHIMGRAARTQLRVALAAERARLAAEQMEAYERGEAQLSVAAPASAPATPAQNAAPTRRVLRIDGKTRKVTASVRSAAPQDAVVVPHAHDGIRVVTDYEDDSYASGRERSDSRDLLTIFPYIEPQFRPQLSLAVESETNSEIPDLDLLLLSKPVGSAADTELRQRNRAVAAATARSRGRKSGKSGRART
ncbi:hypothetical protein MCUN1_002308 [Malassezia cuniculi]|uniref:Uncharacterized protein n=1 Tax=Malassezia cuniculi TaxID=948313 RepID=A0AAF0EUN6_9BASI|nr:hypothetical protein MCUN1_002308 [Malassezia cuniculi]